MVTAEVIDQLLPQLQCQLCGYAGCEPYAAAVARSEAPINRCKPGGSETFAALARLLDIDPAQLEVPRPDPPQLALVDPASCIGCTRCLEACPIDAIIGARHYLHDILPGECTGCGLCIAVCPTDCIQLVPRPETARTVDDPSHPSPLPPLEQSPSENRSRLRERYERHRAHFSPEQATHSRGLTDAERLEEIRMIVRARRARPAGGSTGQPHPPQS